MQPLLALDLLQFLLGLHLLQPLLALDLLKFLLGLHLLQPLLVLDLHLLQPLLVLDLHKKEQIRIYQKMLEICTYICIQIYSPAPRTFIHIPALKHRACTSNIIPTRATYEGRDTTSLLAHKW